MTVHEIVRVTDEDGVLRADCRCGVGIYARIGGTTELADRVSRHFAFAAERGDIVGWPHVDIATNTVVWPGA